MKEKQKKYKVYQILCNFKCVNNCYKVVAIVSAESKKKAIEKFIYDKVKDWYFLIKKKLKAKVFERYPLQDKESIIACVSDYYFNNLPEDNHLGFLIEFFHMNKDGINYSYKVCNKILRKVCNDYTFNKKLYLKYFLENKKSK